MVYFGHRKNELESLNAIYTASEIHQRPSTWKKTVQQIKDNKEALKAFIEQVTGQEDYDVVLAGAGTSEIVGNGLFSYLNKKTNF